MEAVIVMDIASQSLKDILSQFDATLSYTGRSLVRFSQIRFLEFPLNEDCLYVIYASQLEQLEHMSGLNFVAVCIQDIPFPGLPSPWSAKVDLFLLSGNVSLPALFNRLLALVSNQNQYKEQSIQSVINHVTQGDSLDVLISCISRVLHAPAAVLSSGFQVIAASDAPDFPAPVWDTMVDEHFYPHFDLKQLLVTSVGNTPTSSISQVRSFTRVPGLTESFVPIIADNVTRSILGYLYFIQPSEQLQRCSSYEIGFLASLLSWRLWRYTHQVKANDVQLGLLLTDILGGAVQSNRAVELRLKNSGVHLTGNKFLIVVYTSATTDKHTLDHFKQMFSMVWPEGCLITYSSDIIFLIHSEDESLNPERLSVFTNTLIQCDCYAGISNSFRQVNMSIKNYYIRCLAAARMAKQLSKKKRFAQYDEIAIFHFVHEGPPAFSLRQVCNPSFLQLLDHDRKYSSDYIRTLRCYWYFERNIALTCQYLHIHRNTLFYRLNKLADMLHQDINSFRCYTDVALSIEILVHLGELPPLELS